MLKLIPPAYGYLNDCKEGQGKLYLSGWLLLPDGPFDRFQARLEDGTSIPIATRHQPSLAKAISRVPGADAGGFLAEIPMPDLAPGQVLETQILGIRDGAPAGSMIVGYHRSDTPQEYPPSEVMKRAAFNDSHTFWRATGIKACNDIRRAARPHLDLDTVDQLLEWGCGSGRLTKHLIDVFPETDVHGTDIDVEAVHWADRHLRGRFIPCEKEPPLPYSDDSFDFIVCLSVFTHLTREFQEAWLLELARVLRPRGLLLATAKGEFAARWELWNPDRINEVMSTGFSDVLPDYNLKHVAGPEYYRATWQTYAYTKEFWGQYLEVVDFVEGGINNLQDLYVLRNRSA